MKKTAIALLIILIAQLFVYLPAAAAPPFGSVAAESVYLAERDNGIILFEKNANQRHPADSLTKILTLLLASLAVENDEISDNELIEMTETAWLNIEEDDPTQSIQPGQSMTFIDLMYSSYVGDATEASNMIALRLAGSINAFVTMMNEKVKEFGCENTNFVNPHGQYHPNQYTTAYDMFVIYREASKSMLFNEVSSTFRHITERIVDMETEAETESRTLISSNSMLNQSSIYYYRYCVSGISSATYEGGHSFVAVAEEDDLALISVVLGARDVVNEDETVTLQNFTETQRLFMWAYTNFGWREILRTTDLLAKVPILHGSGADFINVRPERSLVMLLDVFIDTDSFDLEITIDSEVRNTPLIAPVSAGDKLGEVVVSREVNGNVIVYDTIPLVANTTVELNGIEYMRRQIIDILSTRTVRYIIAALIVIVIIYLALLVRYNVMRINRLRRIKNAKNELIRERHENFRD